MRTTLFSAVVATILLITGSVSAQWTQVAHGAKLDTTWAGEIGNICLAAPGKYLAVTDAGVYRSTDDGITWGAINMSIASYHPCSIYKHLDGRIFCGTWLGGLFVSTDAGVTWSHVAGHPDLPVMRMTKDSQGRLFTGLWPSSRIGGVCQSTDNGTTWTKVLDSLYIEVVEIGPGDVLFAGAGYNQSGVDIGGLWRSTNAGTTWQTIYPAIGVRSVTVAADGSILMGGYSWNPGFQQHTYRSTNNGANWTQCGAFYSEFFATDANNFVYAACDTGLRRSTDNGASWTALNSGLINRNGAIPWLRCLHKVGDNVLIAGEYHTGEIFRSTDLGAHWSASSPLRTSGFVSGKLAAIAPKDPGQLFLGSSLYGMLRWDAVGGLVRINNGLGNSTAQTVYVGRTGNVFAGTASGIYRSTNNGAAWARFGTISLGITALGDFATGEVLVGTGNGIVKYSADGGTMTVMNAGLVNRSVHTLWTGTDGRTFTGTDDGLYRLDSTTSTWVSVSVSPSNLRVIDIKIDRQTLAVATRDSGVFVSTDNGQFWQRKRTGIEGFALRGLALVAPDRLYAATEQNGIDSTTTGGAAWIPFSQGLNDLNMRGVALGPGGYLYAITDSGAVVKTTRPVTAVKEAFSDFPTAFALAQNYPNPFNPSTTIRYALPHTSFVTLTVYNTLGQQVAQLVNEQQQAGYHDVVFRGDGLASGVYFYRLTAGEFVSTKRLLLLK